MIVDDNPKVLKLLEKDFGRLGIAVTACMSYEEARNHLRGREFDAMAAEQSIGGRSAVDFVCRFRAVSRTAENYHDGTSHKRSA